jgi:hypothetical protein
MWGLGLAALAALPLAGDARPLLAWLALPLAITGLMSARKQSVRLGTLSVLTWTLQGLGLVVGWFRLGASPGVSRGARC